ncbi:unnamed protein product [Prorocentrum cordatum]|uniref:Endonuclease/exonuclease/phosphatase domain-containing protein n=1 Tax=Prorocentrum cordatum TaxID=2364126 RepID=A0ABN9P753_9DINO|nr:unnamed protein product [Polarella glacialis]
MDFYSSWSSTRGRSLGRVRRLAPVRSAPPVALARLAAECGLVHAAAQARGTTGAGAAWAPGGADGRALETLRLCRPTFGYAEGCPGSAERWLTSYGKGGPQQLKCDDAILSRGLVAVDFQELPLALPEHLRPHPRVTHLSDHWAVRATLRPG